MARIARGVCALLLGSLVVLAAVLPAVASADAGAPGSAVAPGRVRLVFDGTFTVGSQEVTITGRSAQAEGLVTPFVAGQVVAVRVWEGRRLLKSETLAVKPAAGASGRFWVRFSSRAAGRVKITATHLATPQQASFTAAPRTVRVVAPSAGPGSRGLFVSLIQSRLAALHYAVPQDGVYDTPTQNAILAYRKVRGWERIFTLDHGVVRGLLNGTGTFQVRYPGQGRHVEADLTDQTLALINGAHVYQIYPISSGKPSTPTVLGTYHVYSRVPGYLPDGMYFSNFFFRGYAIHGYDPSPTYPASHGCLRLPIDDAIAVYDWITYGTTVDVYYGAN